VRIRLWRTASCARAIPIRLAVGLFANGRRRTPIIRRRSLCRENQTHLQSTLTAHRVSSDRIRRSPSPPEGDAEKQRHEERERQQRILMQWQSVPTTAVQEEARRYRRRKQPARRLRNSARSGESKSPRPDHAAILGLRRHRLISRPGLDLQVSNRQLFSKFQIGAEVARRTRRPLAFGVAPFASDTCG
jgi:hypothetical protein